jgi:hypothetical protein
LGEEALVAKGWRNFYSILWHVNCTRSKILLKGSNQKDVTGAAQEIDKCIHKFCAKIRKIETTWKA